LRGRRLGLFLVLLLFTVLLNNLLWLRFPTARVLPPPGVPTEPPAPSVPLLGSLTIFMAAMLFDAGPAMVAGLVAGLVRGGLDSSRVFAPPELAVFGLIVGLLLHQSYQGRDWRLLRWPLVAGVVGAGCHWALLWAGVYSAIGGSSLSALDYTRSLMLASVGAVAVDGLLGGLLTQGLYLLAPQLKPKLTGVLTPPHLRSMNRRLLLALIPLTLVMVVVIFSAVTTAAVRESINQVVDGMVRSANSASETIPLLFNTGQELLKRFAAADELRSSNPEVRQRVLEADLRLGAYGPFFSQLILYDLDRKPTNHYPQDGPTPELSPEEDMLLRRTLSFGSPERSHVFATQDGHLISFIVVVEDENKKPYGALVGRSRLSVNPMVDNLLSSLEGPEGSDSGFIVDERGQIAFHPDGTYLLQTRSIDLECPEISGISAQVRAQAQGRACQDLASDGTRRLIYFMPVEAMGNWMAVITYPYEVVLDRATRVSGQVLLILLMVTGVLAVAVPWLTSRLTRPLQLLSTAARGIADGQLENQVTLTGEDEVGQLGRAFEQMRLSLKGRLDDLSLLLRVSQAVSSNLDLTTGIPTILEGALQATDARIARLILLDERGAPQMVMAHGEGSSRVTALDRAMARLGRRGEPVRIERVAAARGPIEPGLAAPDIRAVIAVPMRSKDHDVGVMWLGYGEAHQFSDTEVDFLSTLASQAAVAVENARLFQSAEGGRGRLAAILESTSDAVIRRSVRHRFKDEQRETHHGSGARGKGHSPANGSNGPRCPPNRRGAFA
jgi:HAMP domain-containing protein